MLNIWSAKTEGDYVVWRLKKDQDFGPGYSVVDKLFVVVHMTNVYIRFHMAAILIIAHSKLISLSGMH